MREKIKNIFRTRGLEISIYIILILIIFNGTLILHYRNVIAENVHLQDDVESILFYNDNIDEIANQANMALRGYMISQQADMLTPMDEAMALYRENLEQLEKLLQKHQYNIELLEAGREDYEAYMSHIHNMADMVSNGQQDKVQDIMSTDELSVHKKGIFQMQSDVDEFAGRLQAKAMAEYQTFSRSSLITQIMLFVLAVPLLIIIARSLRRSYLNRIELFKNLDQNHKKYLFNPGASDQSFENESSVINDLVANLRKASHFINNITDGNYKVKWEGLDETNQPLNENTLAGELVKMRDQMIKVKREDDVRLWKTEGFSKFGDMIRAHHNDVEKLSGMLISNLVKYLEIKQGGLFIVNDDNEHDVHLELMGCYAYEREKMLKKKVDVYEGLVGQCYLEKESIHLTNVPENYVNITSGLGESNPNTLLLVPLMVDDKVIGVVELASLRAFQEHEISFVSELGESIASAIANVKSNQGTKELLERAQQQAEELKAQEEEMRQNMEELQATQDSLHRESQENETARQQLESSRDFLERVIEEIPEPVFVKDRSHKYVLVNDAYCKLYTWSREKMVDKTDHDLLAPEDANKVYEEEERIFESGKPHESRNEMVINGQSMLLAQHKRTIRDPDQQLFLIGVLRRID